MVLGRWAVPLKNQNRCILRGRPTSTSTTATLLGFVGTRCVLRGRPTSTSTTATWLGLFDPKVMKILPIFVIHHFLESRLHTGRDAFVTTFLVSISFGTIFDNGVDIRCTGGSFCYRSFIKTRVKIRNFSFCFLRSASNAARLSKLEVRAVVMELVAECSDAG
jgi:hypothetical protein